ncbi:RF-1 domain-containing protein [Trichoderma sp. SZMC 28014]
MSRPIGFFLTTAFPIVPLARAIPSLRSFSTLGGTLLKNLPPRPKPPPDSEIEESYLKGSGPGGQKINKTNSAVQLKHIPTGIVVKSQATRSRSQNRKLAREILAQKVDEFVNGDQSRSAIVGAIKKKKADSAAKKSRRKYRRLEEGEEDADAEVAATLEDIPDRIAEQSSDTSKETSNSPSSSPSATNNSQPAQDSQHRHS